MTRRFGGMDFDISLGTTQLHVESATLDVTDNTAVALTRGIPDGFVDGEVSAEGELVLDEKNFAKLGAEARAAGSWRGMPVFDILFYAETAEGKSRVQAFGCKLKLSSLFSADPKGGEKSTKTVPFIVTSPDFVWLDGLPYLSAKDTRGIVG